MIVDTASKEKKFDINFQVLRETAPQSEKIFFLTEDVEIREFNNKVSLKFNNL